MIHVKCKETFKSLTIVGSAMYGLVAIAILHLGGGGIGSLRLGRVVGCVQANKEVVNKQHALVPPFLLSPPSLAPASPDARGPREGAGMGARSWGHSGQIQHLDGWIKVKTSKWPWPWADSSEC
jgi:hypothetical protein